MNSNADKPISILHVSDIHFGSGLAHGHINPNSGLNVRLEDFELAVKKSVDYAISQQVDLYLFSGDAYKTAAPEPIYQKLLAQQLRRLSDADIKSILLVGNHDQTLRSNSSHAMSVFQSLAVPNLTIIDEPCLLNIDTAHGALQLIGIPHVTRHLLMTHEQYASASASEVEKVLATHVRAIIEDLCSRLNPDIPALLTAHMMVDKARAGAEQDLMIGYALTFPLDMLLDRRLDYVALGHVHRHQVLQASQPAVVYAGSIERVDFGEENEDKGFVHVALQRQQTTFTFHSIDPRPFITVKADLTGAEDATAALAAAVSEKQINGCVLRLCYKIRQDQTASLDEQKIQQQCRTATSVQFKPEIVATPRPGRLPQLDETLADNPLAALDTYLTQAAPQRKEELLKKARALQADLEKH